MPSIDLVSFLETVREARRGGDPADTLAVAVSVRLLDDQLTPVLAYRRLVAPDERTAPSFLFESVEGGERQGRHSLLGAQPALEVTARRREGRNIVAVRDHRTEDARQDLGARDQGAWGRPRGAEFEEPDPLTVPRRLTKHLRLVRPRGADLPAAFIGGWVGYASYDTVRYGEPEKLAWERGADGAAGGGAGGAPPDDRGLPELDFAYYDGAVVFDHVDKLVHVVRLAHISPEAEAEEIERIYARTMDAIERRVAELQFHSRRLGSGRIEGSLKARGEPMRSNLSREQHAAMVARAIEYIRAGDVFQVVLGQRFERQSAADPFDVYRALRAVNPSPYMVYLQAQQCILVASSPEILCRVRSCPDLRAVKAGRPRLVITNRPLAGTRRRGGTPEEDAALERELLVDPKERAEHTMLVDLGRNDVGRVAKPGSVELPRLMEVERYSHVMHISSTVTGELREGLDAWDALRATLPVGTISGAPKIRAMQIIDELEQVRRGPYGGGMGYVSLDGDMDIALALRTMVVPTGGVAPGGDASGGIASHDVDGSSESALPDADQRPVPRTDTGQRPVLRKSWTYHIQAAGGIVLDSRAEAEFDETVNKAAALARAIDVAEEAFSRPPEARAAPPAEEPR